MYNSIAIITLIGEFTRPTSGEGGLTELVESTPQPDADDEAYGMKYKVFGSHFCLWCGAFYGTVRGEGGTKGIKPYAPTKMAA